MNKRTIESTTKAVPSKNLVVNDMSLKLNEGQIKDRLSLFETFYQQNQDLIAKMDHKDIAITLPDEKVIPGKYMQTTPLEIAKGISKKLAERVVAARVIYKNKVESPFGDVIDCDEAHDEATDDSDGEDDDLFKDKLVKKETNEFIVDLSQPLLGDCRLELITFDDPKGKEVFWHSSAHILGYSLEKNFGAFLTHGPPLESGFFYDSFTGNKKLTPNDYEQIETKAKEIIKQKLPFQKIYINKEQALDLFKDNPFKVSLIKNKIKEGSMTSAYRCGELVDLCTGPHLPDTGRVKAFKITKNSACYWLGNQENDSLQRVYSMTFPQEKQLKKWVRVQEELAKKDHRNIGEQQKLFYFSNESPGCTFFLKHGTRIFNRLQNLMKQEYFYRGFDEVNTPTMFKSSLWKISGHYFKYLEDMFFLKADDEEYGLKPMNCPSHCLIFNSDLKSYRDLPIRMADFGVLHRNEDSGALTGLTRVRKFHQDDAHIFCRKDQIESEIYGQLAFIKYVYNLLGLNYSFELSTRPKNFVGDKKLWRSAEEQLKNVLDKVYPEWKLNKGDGAFYGPKIDVKVTDVYNRKHQLGTIQLDFNLPIRFNLQYKDKEGETEKNTNEELTISKMNKDETKEAQPQEEHECENEHDEMKGQDKYAEEGLKIGGKLKSGFSRPIIVHRAILGSLERCIAILCEHFGGKWPFWVSPRQIAIVPVSDKFLDYADSVEKRLSLEGYFTDVIRLNATLNKKVRTAQMAQYNYILVVGEKEETDNTVNVRIRDQKKPKGVMKMGEFLRFLKELAPPKSEAQLQYEEQAGLGGKDNKMAELEATLKVRMFFDNDGMEAGQKDDETLKELEGNFIDSEKYPNVTRWRAYMERKNLKK
jgi:threonyl-tRNA synthetase